MANYWGPRSLQTLIHVETSGQLALPFTIFRMAVRKEWITGRAHACGPSAIYEASALANEFEAVNLAEGTPDFPAPLEAKSAAIAAIWNDYNQYRVSTPLKEELARVYKDWYGLCLDPHTNIVLSIGQTGAFISALSACIEMGDEVIIFDPCYETYPACVRIAGGTTRFVELKPPQWTFTKADLEAAVRPNTKAIILNSPHNPTGKVFDVSELQIIADVACRHGLLVITDEVYEKLTYDGVKHTTIAMLPGMWQRTIITSSCSKSFSITGWRIGWAIAPASLAAAVENMNTKFSDSPPAPLQEAAIACLRLPPTFYDQLQQDYIQRRDYTCDMLRKAGLGIPHLPQGSMFIFAEIPQDYPFSDMEYVYTLIKEAGVAFMAGSCFFYGHADNGRAPSPGLFPNTVDMCTSLKGTKRVATPQTNDRRLRYVRVAFCKDVSTLKRAGRALEDYAGRCQNPGLKLQC